MQKHGIYREIPYKYQARGGNYKLDIDVLSVIDENNNPVKFRVTRDNGAGLLNIQIGHADKYVTGEQIYIINYKVSGAINYFSDHDELYWNITGNDWDINIKNVSAVVILPQKINNFQAQCFTGYQGQQISLCSKNIQSDKVSFQAVNFLSKQGLTVVVGWPKGITAEPSFFLKIIKKIKDNLILLLPVFVLVFLYFYWRRHGKDPIGRGTIMPEYEPPANILPAEAGIVIDEKMDTRDLTATIIDLARRGYLKIKQEDKKILGLNAGKDWEIIRMNKSWEAMYDYEKDLMDALFDSHRKNSVLLNSLKKDIRFGKKIKQLKKSVYADVAEKGWFEKNPNTVRAIFSGIGIGLIIFCFAFLQEVVGVLFIFTVILSAIILIIFAQFMPKKTKAGAEIKEKLDGFKMFLSATEKDRVKFHFSPQANPEKFADYLAWAIIFKVEKEWAKVFQGTDLPAPDWYAGTWAGNYTAWAMADSLSSLNNNFSKTLTAAGAGASRGISGFGGGGFSGGGFGGGGGGSW